MIQLSSLNLFQEKKTSFPSLEPWSHHLPNASVIKQTSKNQPHSIFNTKPHRGQLLRFGMSELLNHTCFGLADRLGAGLGVGERESTLLTGNNGPQISTQVSLGPLEAFLIQLEPRWVWAANDLTRESSFFFPRASLYMIHNSVHILTGYHFAPTV